MSNVSKIAYSLVAMCAVVGSASGETATLPVGGAAIHLDASDRSTMTIEKANNNFVAWEDAGDATNTYLNAFADQWKPVGYIVVHKGERWGNVGKWFVPHNFNAGMKVLVR